jgi:hypothetical protein
MENLAPERKRNQTIDADSWNPLTEHSSKILDRMDPFHIFGKGSKKLKSFHEIKKQMPRNEHQPIQTFWKNGEPIRGGTIASRYVDKYTTAKEKAALKREAKSALDFARPFVPAGQQDIVDNVVSLIHGLGIGGSVRDRIDRITRKGLTGGKVGTNLGKRLAGITGDLIESGADRAMREMSGGRVGTDLGKRLAGITGDLIESGAERAQREMSGGKVNRLKKAKRWEGFAVDTANDGLDVAGDTYDLVNRIRNPVGSAAVNGIKDFFGFGMDGCGPKRIRRKYVRKTETVTTNPWIAYVKEFKKHHPEMSHGEALHAAKPGYHDQKAGYAAKRKSYAPMRPDRAI